MMLAAIGAVVLFILILIIGALVSKGGGNSTGLVDVSARAQEIIRVTNAEKSDLKDPSALSVAATVNAVVSSEQSQINNYLTSKHIKTDKKKLAIYQSSATDTQMAAALQANSLDTTYTNYLRSALTSYAQAIQTAYASTSNATTKSILQNAYASTETLLTTPPLKS